MAVWSELWNSILQARLDQMGWNLKWFIFELFLTGFFNGFWNKTVCLKMWFYAVSKMLYLTLTLCLSLSSQQMAFFPICIVPCLCIWLTFQIIPIKWISTFDLLYIISAIVLANLIYLCYSKFYIHCSKSNAVGALLKQ